MKILALSNAYVPTKSVGGHFTLHAMLTYLIDAGEQVRVATTHMAQVEPYSFDGVFVDTRMSDEEIGREVALSDVVIAQLDAMDLARSACTEHQAPLVHIAHTNDVKTRRILKHDADMVVYVSEWLKRELSPVSACDVGVVVRAPVNPDAYRVLPGEKIALINLSLAKGADVFYELARRMPHREFLGVVGGHEQQLVQPGPNIEILANGANMREHVYAKTRLLLMPSRSESFGRVGIEAAASGIPAIASPTEGLPEVLGDCAWFVRTEDVDGWAAAVNSLLDSRPLYRQYSSRCLARARELWQMSQCDLLTWHAALRVLAENAHR